MRSKRKTGIADALFPKSTQAVLNSLFARDNKGLHLRGMEKLTGQSSGTLQRVLDRLTAAGLVIRESNGNQVFYRANRDCPVYGELRGLITKTSGIADRVAAALQPLAYHIKAAFLFGSVARGEERAGSDIDLMVIGSVSLRQLSPRLAGLQDSLGREINPVTYSPEEYRSKLRDGHHFLTSVQSEPKIFLIGDKDELGRLG